MNNQDAFHWTSSPDTLLIGVVCDGCSSGAHSEVGAKVGARLVIQTLERHLAAFGAISWKQIGNDLLAELGALASALGGKLAQTVTDYLLFTVVGVVITRRSTVSFSLSATVSSS